MNDEGKLLTMIRYAGSDAGREAYDSMLVELARLRAIEAAVVRVEEGYQRGWNASRDAYQDAYHEAVREAAKDLDPTGVCNWCGEECSNAFCRPECYRSYRGGDTGYVPGVETRPNELTEDVQIGAGMTIEEVKTTMLEDLESARIYGQLEGAAVAFGVVGMAEAIRRRRPLP